jgi:cold shock protein
MNSSDTTLEVVRGRVRWFDSKKGYGFITNAAGDDVFVHFTTIEGEGFRHLRAGDTVRFVQSRSTKGLSASQVCRTRGVRREWTTRSSCPAQVGAAAQCHGL